MTGYMPSLGHRFDTCQTETGNSYYKEIAAKNRHELRVIPPRERECSLWGGKTGQERPWANELDWVHGRDGLTRTSEKDGSKNAWIPAVAQ
jgi:hypothetical protein